MAYESKVVPVRTQQLKVNTLVLPFTIVANVTPASKTRTNDAPSVLFLKLEGTGQDYTTVANGGFDTSAEAAAITFATATDSTGVFNALIKVGETISKVISVELHQVGTASMELKSGTSPTGASPSYVTSIGDKIVANFDSAVDLSTTDYNGFIVVQYVLSK
jgi:hypothetical protein